MNPDTSRKTETILGVVAIVVLSLQVAAQEPSQLNALLAGMSANTKQLHKYTFKQRTEIYVGGDLKNAKLDEVHYSISGERVSIPLNDQTVRSEPHRRGPGARLIAKKIEEQKENLRDYTERMMALTSRYLAPEPGKLQAAMAGAEITTGGGSNLLRITIRNYVKFGDRMTMSFDPETKRPIKTDVSTSFEDGPVAIVLTYDQLHDGPTYPGKTVVRSNEKQLELRVLTYDCRL